MRTILGYTMRSFIAFLCLMTAIFLSTTQITNQQKDDSFILNISGRQRMLVQKIVKDILICFNLVSNQKANKKNDDVKIWKEQVLSSIKVFESTLYALKDGGKVPVDIGMTQFRECPPAVRGAINTQLEKVFIVWISLKNNIDRIIYSEFTDISAINYVINNNMKLLEEMDSAGLLMQYNAEDKVRLMAKIQAASIMVGVAIVIFSMFMTKINIVDPIKYFTEAAESMSMGDLKHELRTADKLKELSELSRSMNRLRISTIKMMERLNVERL
ncbi:MAG: type IV pili methyl-accepting chemotaxis transducer N-terminal domain-containing protein [Desulfamplus sp.]|nr:type IV pili methyl-accepting chemotaxis transducer N-terminal domain-containing protein [Desulfamplus sp.]